MKDHDSADTGLASGSATTESRQLLEIGIEILQHQTPLAEQSTMVFRSGSASPELHRSGQISDDCPQFTAQGPARQRQPENEHGCAARRAHGLEYLGRWEVRAEIRDAQALARGQHRGAENTDLDTLGGAPVEVSPLSPATGAVHAEAGSTYLRRRPPAYALRTATMVKAPIAEAFAFFSKAEDLGMLTPSQMKFPIPGGAPVIGEGGT
jgi:hypothetical protein